MMRFTPAYAGKIPDIANERYPVKVHPRIRGEDRIRYSFSVSAIGSPPHTRGRSVEYNGVKYPSRFTPAYAGKI